MRKDLRRSSSALRAAQKIQRRVARLGFDWPSEREVLKKIEEEVRETKGAIRKGRDSQVKEEIGDLLFTVAGLAQKLDLDAETLLHSAHRKFMRRFERVGKELLRRGKKFPQKLGLLDRLWDEVKR